MSELFSPEHIDIAMRTAAAARPPVRPVPLFYAAIDVDGEVQIRLYDRGRVTWRGSLAEAIWRVTSGLEFEESLREAARMTRDLATRKRYDASYYVLLVHPETAERLGLRTEEI